MRLAAVGQAPAWPSLSEHLGSALEHMEVLKRSVEQPGPKSVVNSVLYFFVEFLFHSFCFTDVAYIYKGHIHFMFFYPLLFSQVYIL